MRILVFPLAVAAVALGSCAATPAETARAADRRAAQQAALDKELAGLTPGKTQSCMPGYQSRSASLKAYGPKLVYSVSPTLKYVNDTGGGCENVASGDILVTKSPTGELCSGDIGRTVQPGSSIPSGSCALGNFTVYRK